MLDEALAHMFDCAFGDADSLRNALVDPCRAAGRLIGQQKYLGMRSAIRLGAFLFAGTFELPALFLGLSG